MSQFSLDSLENDSSSDAKFLSGLMKDRRVSSISDNLEPVEDHREDNRPLFSNRIVHDHFDRDAGFNERSVGESQIRSMDSGKFRGNALIARTKDAVVKSCLTGEKLAASLGATTNFRVGRPVAKKFNVERRSSSSLAEFRLRVSQPARRKSPDDIEGFMKADKKLGKPRSNVVDTDKKSPVSYLELHRRKCGVESRRCIVTPGGATPSICDDRTDERLGCTEERTLVAVSRDDGTELGFYRRVMKLGSREPRETRSCEALNRSETNGGIGKSGRYDVSKCFSDVVQSVDRRRRVAYEPYSIEDYKCLSLPQPDRSLGPDRIAIESKVEWLMRRRSYGDSVSSRNRQRILHRAQKLQDSRRADFHKLRLPALTDVENPTPASKVDSYEIPFGRQVDGKKESSRTDVREKRLNRSKSVQTKQADTRASRIGKLPSVVRRSKPGLSKSNFGSEVESGFPDLCEIQSDSMEESMYLRNLQLRHLEEKKRIDRIFKRSLRA